jgi:flagellar FliL protein
MANPPAEAATEAAPAKPKNIKGILSILAIVVNFSVLGGGAFLVYKSTIGHVPVSITEEKLKKEAPQILIGTDAEPYIYTLEKITANLSGEPRMLIQIEVNLEVLDSIGYAEVMSEDMKTRSRDQILKILMSQSFQEVASIQGKLFLKQKIMDSLNAIMTEGVIKNVYFSEFVVQNQ